MKVHVLDVRWIHIGHLSFAVIRPTYICVAIAISKLGSHATDTFERSAHHGSLVDADKLWFVLHPVRFYGFEFRTVNGNEFAIFIDGLHRKDEVLRSIRNGREGIVTFHKV